MDNSNIFSFSIQLTQFESEVLTCLCGCGSNVSSVFKAFAMLFRSVPVVCHPMASPRSGQWSIVYLSTQVYGMLFSIRSMPAQFRGEVKNYGVALLNSSLSVISLILSSLLNPLFSPLAKNLGVQLLFSAVSFSWLHVSRAKWQEDRGRKKNQWGFSLLLGLLKAKITALFDTVSVYVDVIRKINWSFRWP